MHLFRHCLLSRDYCREHVLRQVLIQQVYEDSQPATHRVGVQRGLARPRITLEQPHGLVAVEPDGLVPGSVRVHVHGRDQGIRGRRRSIGCA